MFDFHLKEMAENETEPDETTTKEEKEKSSDEENKTNPGMELTKLLRIFLSKGFH